MRLNIKERPTRSLAKPYIPVSVGRDAQLFEDTFKFSDFANYNAWEKFKSDTQIINGKTGEIIKVLNPSLQNSTEHRLFSARSAAKIHVSKIAMHLNAAQRIALFSKLDALLDADDWDGEDIILKPESFVSYIRFFVLNERLRDHSYGISHEGHFLTGWAFGESKITLEFFENDQVRWSIYRKEEEYEETAVGRSVITRIKTVLAPYEAQDWLVDGK